MVMVQSTVGVSSFFFFFLSCSFCLLVSTLLQYQCSFYSSFVFFFSRCFISYHLVFVFVLSWFGFVFAAT